MSPSQIQARTGDYETYRAAMLTMVARAPGLQPLLVDDSSDWIVAFCDAWAKVAEIISFYQDRVLNEAFLGTATQPASITRIYHSLGHAFPANTTATTMLSYVLRDTAAGVEAVRRTSVLGRGERAASADRRRAARDGAAGSAGTAAAGAGSTADAAVALAGAAAPTGAPSAVAPPAGGGGSGPGAAPAPPSGDGTSSGAAIGAADGRAPTTVGTSTPVPQAAQVRAVPLPDQLPPTYVTLEALQAFVGAGRLQADDAASAAAAPLVASTTQVVLAGTATGVQPGTPIIIEGTDPATGAPSRWLRFATSVDVDRARSQTRVAWAQPLGDGQATAWGDAAIGAPVVRVPSRATAAFGQAAQLWSAVPPADQLGTPTVDGRTVVPRGGVVASSDGGTSWASLGALPPKAGPTCAFGLGDLVLVGTSAAGLFASVDGAPLAAVAGGPTSAVLSVGGSVARLLATTATGEVYQSLDGARTWSAVRGGPPTVARTGAVTSAAKSVAATVAGVAGAVVQAVANRASDGIIPPPSGPVAPSAGGGSSSGSGSTGAGSGTSGPSAPSSSGGASSGTTTVLSHRLPSIAVRCALDAGAGILAGTDSGIYGYDGRNWAQEELHLPVLALVHAAHVGTLAATTKGVHARSSGSVTASASWAAYGKGLDRKVLSLAVVGTTVWAATDSGLLRCPSKRSAWSTVEATGLPKGPVTAIAASGATLLAAVPSGGTYRSVDGGASWQRCDDQVLFVVPDDVVSAAEGGAGAEAAPTISAPLAAAFAAQGMPLDDAAEVVPATSAQRAAGARWQLIDGGRTYLLVPVKERWSVRLQAALGGVSGFAVMQQAVIAVAPQDGVLATEWPGFAIEGRSIELASVVKGLAPGGCAVLQQASAGAEGQVVDVLSVEQVAVAAFGQHATVTRLGIDQDVAGAQGGPEGIAGFDRRSVVVWTGAAVVDLAVAPSVDVAVVDGSSIRLRTAVPEGVGAGRRAVVAGTPVSLAFTAMGGAASIGSDGSLKVVPPSHADACGVIDDATGVAVLATSEGVYGLSGSPELLAAGWPGGGATAVVRWGSCTLAATAKGVMAWDPTATAPMWQRAGMLTSSVVALAVAPGAGAGTVVVATSDGTVLRGRVPGTGAADPAEIVWDALPDVVAIPASASVVGTRSWTVPLVRALALDTRGTTWAVTASGLRCIAAADGAQWVPGDAGLSDAQLTCLVAAPDGKLWAGSASGLSCFSPGPGATWRADATWSASATPRAIGCASDGSPVVATDVAVLAPRGSSVGGAVDHPDVVGGGTGSASIGRTASSGWQQLAPWTGGRIAQVSVTADGVVWLAASADLPVAWDGAPAVQRLGYDLVLSGCASDPTDLLTLDQGGLPAAIGAAIAAAGCVLDPKATVVQPLVTGAAWVVVSGHGVTVLAARAGSGTTTLSAFQCQVLPTAAARAAEDVAVPTAMAVGSPPAPTGPLARSASTAGARCWPVEIDGATGVVVAAAGTVLELAALPGATSVAETVAIGGVVTTADASTGTQVSTLQLVRPLANTYDASTVTVQMNVVPAAQGQVVRRVLGSGNPLVPNQSFSVPTPVATIGAAPDLTGSGADANAPSATGIPSTLRIEVDGQSWRIIGSLLQAAADDQVCMVRTNSDGSAVVHFGDGCHGALLPAGKGNVVATYLQGGGSAGEVAAGALVQPLTRPQLVTIVHNPVDALRAPTPSAAALATAEVRTLGRVVTLQDVHDLAAAQAGVASVGAAFLSTPVGRQVAVTLGRAADAPADVATRVAAALQAARGAGAPCQVAVARSVPVDLTLSASGVDLPTSAALRDALLALAAPAPGAAMLASEVLSAIAELVPDGSVQITAWGRRDGGSGTASAIPAAAASWDPVAAAMVPAELLVVGHVELREPAWAVWPTTDGRAQNA